MRSWLTARPPTIVMPSGWRSSDPTPFPKASGTPPSMAAIVVIMIGPETQQARLIDRFDRPPAFLALRFQRKVDHHDGVLLHDTDQQNDSDQRDDAEITMRDDATPGARPGRPMAASRES